MNKPTEAALNQPPSGFGDDEISRAMQAAAELPDRYKDLCEAARQLAEVLVKVLPLAHDGMPQRGHVGACGPDAGCDGLCVDVAYCSDALKNAYAALANYRKVMEAK